MRRSRLAIIIATMVVVLFCCGMALAHDCSSPSDCEQTPGYNAFLAVVGGAMAVLAALLGTLFGGASGTTPPLGPFVASTPPSGPQADQPPPQQPVEFEKAPIIAGEEAIPLQDVIDTSILPPEVYINWDEFDEKNLTPEEAEWLRNWWSRGADQETGTQETGTEPEAEAEQEVTGGGSSSTILDGDEALKYLLDNRLVEEVGRDATGKPIYRANPELNFPDGPFHGGAYRVDPETGLLNTDQVVIIVDNPATADAGGQQTQPPKAESEQPPSPEPEPEPEPEDEPEEESKPEPKKNPKTPPIIGPEPEPVEEVNINEIFENLDRLVNTAQDKLDTASRGVKELEMMANVLQQYLADREAASAEFKENVVYGIKYTADFAINVLSVFGGNGVKYVYQGATSGIEAYQETGSVSQALGKGALTSTLSFIGDKTLNALSSTQTTDCSNIPLSDIWYEMQKMGLKKVGGHTAWEYSKGFGVDGIWKGGEYMYKAYGPK